MPHSMQGDVLSAKKKLPAALDEPLDRKLFAYASAASAAGVSFLALAQAGSAEVIYTPAHQALTKNGSVAIDLNHDGVTDFTINSQFFSNNSGLHTMSQNFIVRPVGSNAVAESGHNFAAALYSHAKIGAGAISRWVSVSGRMDSCLATRTSYRYSGPWFHNGGYLGLKFTIGGEIHYGWARLNVEIRGARCSANALLTGYAYETIPNRPILAGKTSGKDEIMDIDEPRSALGELALGSAAISTDAVLK